MANPKQIGQNAGIYSQADLFTVLRTRVGTTDEILSNTQALTFLEDARVEINQRKPKIVLGSFSTVADQQFYSTTQANVPATWTGGKLFVFWRGGGSGGACSSIPLGPYNYDASDVLLAAIYGGTTLSAWEIDRVISQYNYFLRRFGARGWMTEGNQILLSPAPTAVETVYYLVPIERFATVTDIDIEYRDVFWLFAVHGAANRLAALQGEIASSEGPDGKDVSTAAGMRWREQADACINRFERLMSHGPTMARLHPGPRFV